MDRSIIDITPLTLLDYPGRTACILWSGGCNMRCLYCYNRELLQHSRRETSRFPSIHGSTTLPDFLRERRGFLDGVVLSGGESTLNPHLQEICALAKSLKYQVKLDTNGSHPYIVRQLLQARLVDYIALDYKAPKHLFRKITGCGERVFRSFSETLDLLIASELDFEVRTTVHADLLSEQDVSLIMSDLKQRGYQNTYYLQQYYHTEDNLGGLLPQQNVLRPHLLPGDVPLELRYFSSKQTP